MLKVILDYKKVYFEYDYTKNMLKMILYFNYEYLYKRHDKNDTRF